MKSGAVLACSIVADMRFFDLTEQLQDAQKLALSAICLHYSQLISPLLKVQMQNIIHVMSCKAQYVNSNQQSFAIALSLS